MTRLSLHKAAARWLASLWLAAAVVPLALAATDAKPLPAFKYAVAEAWLNSKPLTAADLRGKVLLVDLFTTG